MAVALLAAFLVAAGVSPRSAAWSLPTGYDAVWSPDGKQIAFLSYQDYLYVMNANGTGKRAMPLPHTGLTYSTLAWATANRVVFVLNSRLGSVDPASGRAAVLAQSVDDELAASTSGLVAFERQIPDADAIGLVHANGGPVKLLPRPKGTSETSPNFSPDGKMLVFARASVRANTSEDHLSLQIQPVGGGASRTLFTGLAGWPKWSPDGRWIAFTEITSSGQPRLEVVPAAGGSARVLRTGIVSGSYAWAPDSTRLAFLENRKLGIIDLNGSASLLPLGGLTVGENNDESPRWSPDGRKLLFVGIPFPEDTGIYVVGENGRGLRRLA